MTNDRMVQGRKTVTDNQIIEYFERSDEPVFSALELEEVWDMGAEGIRQRLNELVENGELETKKMGSASRVYWVCDK